LNFYKKKKKKESNSIKTLKARNVFVYSFWFLVFGFWFFVFFFFSREGKGGMYLTMVPVKDPPTAS